MRGDLEKIVLEGLISRTTFQTLIWDKRSCEWKSTMGLLKAIQISPPGQEGDLEVMDMWKSKSCWWLALMLLVVLLGNSCSGVLYKSKDENGREDRLLVDPVESWSTYDDKPRKPDSRAKKDRDAMGVILKQESTF
jgi:hypothetical protein